MSAPDASSPAGFKVPVAQSMHALLATYWLAEQIIGTQLMGVGVGSGVGVGVGAGTGAGVSSVTVI